ncbi:hypothetical protein ACFLXC_01205 [Chloroflexota bacterium]
MVWEQVERIIKQPEVVFAEIRNQEHEAGQVSGIQADMQRIDSKLKDLDKSQAQLLRWAIGGFPEATVIAENKRINGERASLQKHRAELEQRLQACQDMAANLPEHERFIQMLQGIDSLDFEGRRLALQMLGIAVLIDGDKVDSRGKIGTEIASPQSR